MAGKREGGITAEDFQQRLNSDPERMAKKHEVDAERAARSTYLKELELGLEQELKDAGIEVKSYRELIHKPRNYKLGIPILVRHMQMEKYIDSQRNFMAQAIAMKDANPFWQQLHDIFLSITGKEEHYAFEQGVAFALGAAYKEPQFEMLLSLCEDQRYGYVRALMLVGLKKSRDPRAEITLMKLCSDPYLGTEMQKWMKKREKRRTSEGRNDATRFN